MKTSDTQPNKDRYIVWGANVTNWNLDIGKTIGGGGQASDMGTQTKGIFGIVTTPLYVTSDNISTLQDIDKSHPEIIESEGAISTKEDQPDAESVADISDKALEEELESLTDKVEEDLEEPDLFLQKFLTVQLDTEFNTALTELQKGRKEGHWIWWFFPQAPFGKTARSLEFSFENKKQVQDYAQHPKLFERFVLLLDTLQTYKQENPEDTLLQIFAKNDRTASFTDKDKFLSSLTLFHSVLSKNNETIQEKISTEDESKKDSLQKILVTNNVIIEKILKCKELFGEEFVFDSNVEALLNIVTYDHDNFKEIIDHSASFSGGGEHTKNTINNYNPSLEKFKNIDTNSLSKLDNLKNLVGGKIADNILHIALQNNNHNVYESLKSLLNTKTREIYELLAKQLLNNK